MAGVLRLLARGARTSFEPRRVALATVGLLVYACGFWLLDLAAPGTVPLPPSVIREQRDSSPRRGAVETYLLDSAWRITEPAQMLAVPLKTMLEADRSWKQIAVALIAVVWTVVVWGIAGGAIARASLLELSGRPATARAGPLRFAIHFAYPLIVAPLQILLAAGVLALASAAMGLLAWIPGGIGPALVRGLFFVPLILGVFMAILLAALLASWSLMHASIAAECDDAGDAISRVLGYINRRVGLFGVLVAASWLIGVPCLALVSILAQTALKIGGWSISLFGPQIVETPDFIQSLVGMAERGWIYAYAWTQCAMIYLILRQEVDGTPLTVVKEFFRPTNLLPRKQGSTAADSSSDLDQSPSSTSLRLR